MQGRYESKLENSKNGFGAILSRVEFQTGPYKSSHPITVYPEQNVVVKTFTRCQAKLSESCFESWLISPLHSIIYKKKLQAIHLVLYKRWCKTAKIKKYKHELMY